MKLSEVNGNKLFLCLYNTSTLFINQNINIPDGIQFASNNFFFSFPALWRGIMTRRIMAYSHV